MDDLPEPRIPATLIHELGCQQLLALRQLQRAMNRYRRPLAEQTWLQAAIDQLETALRQLQANHALPLLQQKQPSLDRRRATNPTRALTPRRKSP
ncbi:hypothetical protein [Paractinoplanes rishiriensis]|uniref:hypothetical protein n=1 Tax=Paractinoplanes rishiriensis TaxID=1050105 RepID=UPI001942084B|nr:hypothetical protein [Actinoplanes rishiriensis]